MPASGSTHGVTDAHFVAAKQIVVYLLSFNFAIWVVFSFVYRYIDFAKHFDVPDSYSRSFDQSMYYAFQVQSQMYGTPITPKTRLGRTLVGIQGTLAWSQMVIFLAPWVAVRHYGHSS